MYMWWLLQYIQAVFVSILYEHGQNYTAPKLPPPIKRITTPPNPTPPPLNIALHLMLKPHPSFFDLLLKCSIWRERLGQFFFSDCFSSIQFLRFYFSFFFVKSRAISNPLHIVTNKYIYSHIWHRNISFTATDVGFSFPSLCHFRESKFQLPGA